MSLSSQQWRDFERTNAWKEIKQSYEDYLQYDLIPRLSSPENDRDTDQYIKGQIDIIVKLVNTPEEFMKLAHAEQLEREDNERSGNE